jgi:bacterioferritin
MMRGERGQTLLSARPKGYLARKAIKPGDTMHSHSVELLNKAVADELAAVHQYMFFHFHCDNQGLELLSSLYRRIAIEEMMHVERLAERILFLKGKVLMAPAVEVEQITDVKDMLAMSMKMEQDSARDYNLWANECGANADSVSKKLFEGLVEDEERHFNTFEQEWDNLNRYGDRYLALQSIERSKKGGMPATQ